MKNIKNKINICDNKQYNKIDLISNQLNNLFINDFIILVENQYQKTLSMTKETKNT